MDEKLLDYNAYETWLEGLPAYMAGFNDLRKVHLPDYHIETDNPHEFAEKAWMTIFDDEEEVEKIVKEVDKIVTQLNRKSIISDRHIFDIIHKEILTVTSDCVVDGAGSRFEIHVTYYLDRSVYILSIINFGIHVQLNASTQLPNFTQFLVDKGLSRIDSEIIQKIFEEVSVDELEKKMQEKYNRPLVNK